VKRFNIQEGKFTTAFQSRLDDKWLKPYSDKVVEELAKSGKEKILVLSPAFVADCLETIHEIGTEYREIFMEAGGKTFDWVTSLNANDVWVNSLKKIILN
jgi:ferrochelatase